MNHGTLIRLALILYGVLAFTGFLNAQEVVYYDSNGFESPKYYLGTLAGSTYMNGQDLWVGITGGTGNVIYSQMRVQNSMVYSGNAAVEIDATGQPSPRTEMYRGTFFFMDPSMPIMEVELDLRISTGASTNTQRWILVNQQTAMTGLHQLHIMDNGKMEVWDYKLKKAVISPHTFIRDKWQHLKMRFDYAACTATYTLDGIEVFSDINLNYTGGFAYGLIGVFADYPGDDALYMDNLRIVNLSDPAPLMADSYSLPEAGGKINFSLNAGVNQANRNYFMLGGMTASTPGLPLPGGTVALPLVWDLFTNVVISKWNSPIFPNFYSALDSLGQSTAQLNSPGPLPGMAGLKMHFAYALYTAPYNDCDYASNPITITVVP